MSEGTVTLTRPLWTLAMLLIICVNGLTMFEDNIVKVRQVKITGVQPNQVSGNGGTRLHITGSGFETDIFGGRNEVFLSVENPTTRVVERTKCDTIEGACTVDCGSSRKIVCDVHEWVKGPNWGHQVVSVEVVTTDSIRGDKTVALLNNSVTFRPVSWAGVPKLSSVFPTYGQAGSIVTITGASFGRTIKDYRGIYVTKGRPPQGGNIDTMDKVESGICRTEDLNYAANPATGKVDVASIPVLQEDSNPPNITTDKVICRLQNFKAGSYNVSVFLDTFNGRGKDNLIGGLSWANPNDASLFMRDGKGELYNMQYIATIDSVKPRQGSRLGGTEVTITGSGFSYGGKDTVVMIDGVACDVFFGTYEEIRCITRAQKPGNSTYKYGESNGVIPSNDGTGCTNWRGANFDASASVDDGSCLFVGGRGLTKKTVAVLGEQYTDGKWKKKTPMDTHFVGSYCAALDVNGSTFAYNTSCDNERCPEHQQCPVDAFCCLNSEVEGCTPSTKFQGRVDENGWLKVFNHEISLTNYNYVNDLFKTNEFRKNADTPGARLYSVLDEWETWRRMTDGYFELKMCYPNSVFGCIHWFQGWNPINAVPESLDVSSFVPYDMGNATSSFRGLRPGRANRAVLEGAKAGMNDPWYTLGATWVSDKGFLASELAPWWATHVELYVRPDPQGAACVSCLACYDDDGKPKSSARCPAYCFEEIGDMRAVELESIAALKSELEGKEEVAVLESISEFQRYTLGGEHHKAFFVAPVDGHYTFRSTFDDEGEVWFSPNGSPSSAELVIQGSGGSYGPVELKEGLPHFFEVYSLNNGGSGKALLTLRIQTKDGRSWETSTVRGLSGEFFRMIEDEFSNVALSVDAFAASCNIDGWQGGCFFNYSTNATPVVETVYPLIGNPGDEIEIFGRQFSHIKEKIHVDIGGGRCIPSFANSTYIRCTTDIETATAGTFPLWILIDGKGNADSSFEYTVKMQIYDVSPSVGSLTGGNIVTITGAGFARFGLHQQITVGSHPCIPVTYKNRQCRMTDYDTGIDCKYPYVYNYAGINVRELAEWFDFSSTQKIECRIAHIRTAEADQVGERTEDVTVTIANTNIITDVTRLGKDLESARKNMLCDAIYNCVMRDETFKDTNKFGFDYVFDGAVFTAADAYIFSDQATPHIVMDSIIAMAGNVLSIKGSGFTGAPITDKNWYYNEFGYFEQRRPITIMVNETHCLETFSNDTLITCIISQNYLPGDVAEVIIDVYGKGYASKTIEVTYGLTWQANGQQKCSLAGGCPLTLTVDEGSLAMDKSLVHHQQPGASFLSVILGEQNIDENLYCNVESNDKRSLVCIPGVFSLPEVRDSTELIEKFGDYTTDIALLAYWNYEPFNAACSDRNGTRCKYTYSAAYTPLYTLNRTVNSTVGSFLELELLTDTNSSFYDWGSSDEFDLKLVETKSGKPSSCLSVNKTLVPGRASELTMSVGRISCDLGSDISPGLYEVKLFVEGKGYALDIYKDTFTSSPVIEVRASISRVSHAASSLAGGLSIVINGHGLRGVESVLLAGIPCEDVQVISSTEITCTSGAFPGAQFDSIDRRLNRTAKVEVVATGLVAICNDGCAFSYLPGVGSTPQVLSFDPHEGSPFNASADALMTILGHGFEHGTIVTIGFKTCETVTYSKTRITCKIPQHVGGIFPVSVYVPGKGLSLGAQDLKYKYPLGVTAVSPDSGSVYLGQEITITGHGFCATAGAEDQFDCWNHETLKNRIVLDLDASVGFDVQSATYNKIIATTYVKDVGFYGQKRVKCPFGWNEFDGACYKAVFKGLTWPEARKKCVEEERGYLAQPTTQSHYDFVSKLFGGWHIFWIGGYRAGDKNSYKWAKDDKPIPASDIVWLTGNPHDGNPNPGYLMLRELGWDRREGVRAESHGSSSTFYYACQIDPLSTSVPAASSLMVSIVDTRNDPMTVPSVSSSNAHTSGLAFDRNTSTVWLGEANTENYLMRILARRTAVHSYGIAFAADLCPIDWEFKGSNDGNEWTVLDVVSSFRCDANHKGKLVPFSARKGGDKNEYLMYALFFSKVGTQIKVAELQMSSDFLSDAYAPVSSELYSLSRSVTPMVTSVTREDNFVLKIKGTLFSTTCESNTVYIGDKKCPLISCSATQIMCTAPLQRPGVYPVTVKASNGFAGPVPGFSFEYDFEPFSINPSGGSIAGGQFVTIAGRNFVADTERTFVDFEGSVCEVKSVTDTSIICVTGQTPKSENPKRTDSYNSKVSVTVESEDFDDIYLRIQSQEKHWRSEYTYPNQSPGIVMVNAKTGFETVLVDMGNVDDKFGVFLLNTATRTIKNRVVRRSITDTWEQDEVINLINSATREDLVIAITHAYPAHDKVGSRITSALKKCGGSNMLDRLTISYNGNPTLEVRDRYVFVGQCGAGLAMGWSEDVGLELTSKDRLLTLEFNPYDFFKIGKRVEIADETYRYDSSLTPFISSISRTNGTTAGGTTVHISGEDMSDDPLVTIGGVVCSTRSEQIQEYRNKSLCDWDGVQCGNIHGSDTSITCLTNPWSYSSSPWKQDVKIYVEGKGNALAEDGVHYSYVDFWSSRTTWGGRDPPSAYDSVVITEGQYIVMDVSPPPLGLLYIEGVLEFDREAGDLALNASYIFIYGGMLRVGTEDQPFENKAVITLEGTRKSPEIPVYGAKCIAVRNGILDLHGQPKLSWTRLIKTAQFGDTVLHLEQPVDWSAGDEIFVTSTEYDMMESESFTIVSVNGTIVEVDSPLEYTHTGDGYHYSNIYGNKTYHGGIRAEVGLKTRNVVIQGDHNTQKDMFGAQIVLHSDGDNSLIGRIRNVEVRNSGQGLKLGKYAIHFHMIGNVSKSYIANCSVHGGLNRGIAIHGVNSLLVEHNTLYDIRGHAVFIEDGTEIRNTIRYNLVALVRPVESLLAVDMSPACYWIVNPNNDVYGNVAAGSSNYGFWYRALLHPDGVSGQHLKDEGTLQCPAFTPLGRFDGNTAHSTGKHGLKLNDYFPSQGGEYCKKNTFPVPAVFMGFTSWKNNRFCIWGEIMVDVSFSGIFCADHNHGGLEFAYMNGKGTLFAKSSIKDSIFIGRMNGTLARAAPAYDTEWHDGIPDSFGLYAPKCEKPDSGCLHALHLPGLGSNLVVKNTQFINYDVAFFSCAWCEPNSGGYEVEFENVKFTNVNRPVNFVNNIAGILIDVDGSLGIGPGGRFVPPTEHLINVPHCKLYGDSWEPKSYVYRRDPITQKPVFRADAAGHAWGCTVPVRRIAAENKFITSFLNVNVFFQWPILNLVDITDYDPKINGSVFDLPRLYKLNGPYSCFEQAPHNDYRFLGVTGRKYVAWFTDYNKVRVEGLLDFAVMNMKSEESIVISLALKHPFSGQPELRAGTIVENGYNDWYLQEPVMGWQPPPVLPQYGAVKRDGSQVCGANTPVCEPNYGGCLNSVDAKGCQGTFFGQQLASNPTFTSAGIFNQFDMAVSGQSFNGGQLKAWMPWDAAYAAHFCVRFQAPSGSDPLMDGTKVLFEQCMPFPATGSPPGHFDRWVWNYNFYDQEFYGNNTWMTIQPWKTPWFCLDILKDIEGNPANVVNGAVVINACDGSPQQRFGYLPGTNQLVHHKSGLCLWARFPRGGQRFLSLKDCKWASARINLDPALAPEFFMGQKNVGKAHGAFFYEPFLNAEKRKQDEYLINPRKDLALDPTNTSLFTVVLAGNSTVRTMKAHGKCPIEGCKGVKRPPAPDIRMFKWCDGDKDFRNWNVNNQLTDIPHDWSYTIIPKGWTVTLNCKTPIMSTLEVWGKVIYENTDQADLELHAVNLILKGGQIWIGNSTHPFNGKSAKIEMHGDFYLHGKGNTAKFIKNNGAIHAYGKKRTSIVALGADAFKGATRITLAAPGAKDWQVGDEIGITRTSVDGQKVQYFKIAGMHPNGLHVTLDKPIDRSLVGTLIEYDYLGKPIDMRARVFLMTRNVHINGGLNQEFDFYSGVHPQDQEYGLTMRLEKAYKVAKDGWKTTDPGYFAFGIDSFPDGTFNVNHVSLARIGKMTGPIMGVLKWEVLASASKNPINMVDSVFREPYGGTLFNKEGLTNGGRFSGNIVIGQTVNLAPSKDATLEFTNNIFIGGLLCRLDCPEHKMLNIKESEGSLNAVGNVVTGGVGGFNIDRQCNTRDTWRDNVAIGNMYGYIDTINGCASAEKIAYKNGIGYLPNVETASNVLAAENGVGVFPMDFGVWPTFKKATMEWATKSIKFRTLTNSTIVGRTTFQGFLDCDVTIRGKGHWHPSFATLGFRMAGTRNFYPRFTGFQPNAIDGLDDDNIVNTVYHGTLALEHNRNAITTLTNVIFDGFNGVDACGIENFAISNEHAAHGEDSEEFYVFHGTQTCHPMKTSNLAFKSGVTTKGRLQFSKGHKGYAGAAEKGFSKCRIYDTDGSLVDQPVPEGSPPHLLIANVPRRFPSSVEEDCAVAANEGKDGSLASSCLWWMKENPYVLGATLDPRRQGIPHTGHSGYEQGKCEPVLGADSNALVCKMMEFVELYFDIPKHIVSGSEVFYGPVAFISMDKKTVGTGAFEGDKTVVYFAESFINPWRTGHGVKLMYPLEDAPVPYNREIQPHTALLVNHGYYRLAFTGDITVFSPSGDLGFEFLTFGTESALHEDWGIVLDIPLPNSRGIQSYYGGKSVPNIKALSKFDLDTSPAGSVYMNTGTNVMSIIVKGTKRITVRLLKVIVGNFGIKTSFSSFFADNSIDPNAVADEFKHLIPPDYAATYDPDNGNIVKSNPFVSNLAGVLKINPSRIRVVNVVPGNARRRLLGADGERVIYDRYLAEEAEDLGVKFVISAEDKCASVNCSVNGACDPANGKCTCNVGFFGTLCESQDAKDEVIVVVEPPAVASKDEMKELVAVATVLTEKATSGALDTGYVVTSVAVAVPKDICGVPGGNGTTCNDACGVANGDNSTCADSCGVPKGNGLSCVTVATDFTTCVGTEKQSIKIEALDQSIALAGQYQLRYNGEVTKILPVMASADDIKYALMDLASLQSAERIKITGLLTGNSISLTVSDKLKTLYFGVEVEGLRFGSLPMIEIVGDKLVNRGALKSTRVCAASYPSGYIFEEQEITINGTDPIRLELNTNNTGSIIESVSFTGNISTNMTAQDVAKAITKLGEGNDISFATDAFGAYKTASGWRIRFHATQKSDMLKFSLLGNFPTMTTDAPDRVTVKEIVMGVAPAEDMPVKSFLEAAAAAGEEAMEKAQTAEEVEEVQYTEPVYVCGDAVRGSPEGCDDGNKASGDGCDRNCTIESGYYCSVNAVGSQSSCDIPDLPLIQFSSANYHVNEGNLAHVVVEKLGNWSGDPNITFSVIYRTADSSATSKTDGSNNAAFGWSSGPDYKPAHGTLTFAAQDTSLEFTVEVLNDASYDGSDEKIALILSNPTGGALLGNKLAYITIQDVDSAPTHTPTPAPTAVPTVSPTPDFSVYVVEGSATFVGYNVQTFDQAAKDAFKASIADLSNIHFDDVSITSIRPASRRKLEVSLVEPQIAGGLNIGYTILFSDESVANAAFTTLSTTTGAAFANTFSAQLSSSGGSVPAGFGVSSMAVSPVEQVRTHAPTYAPTEAFQEMTLPHVDEDSKAVFIMTLLFIVAVSLVSMGGYMLARYVRHQQVTVSPEPFNVDKANKPPSPGTRKIKVSPKADSSPIPMDDLSSIQNRNDDLSNMIAQSQFIEKRRKLIEVRSASMDKKHEETLDRMDKEMNNILEFD